MCACGGAQRKSYQFVCPEQGGGCAVLLVEACGAAGGVVPMKGCMARLDAGARGVPGAVAESPSVDVWVWCG